MLSWLFDGFAKREQDQGSVEKDRKPKPKDWKSKVIAKLTITPRKGHFTEWNRTAPVPAPIEAPAKSGPQKPEHIVPVGFQKPPSLWRDPRFIAATVVVLLALAATFAIRHP